MITTDQEFYSSPYYFLLRDKGDKYSLYFSVEGNLNEAREKDEVIHFEKEKGEKLGRPAGFYKNAIDHKGNKIGSHELTNFKFYVKDGNE